MHQRAKAAALQPIDTMSTAKPKVDPTRMLRATQNGAEITKQAFIMAVDRCRQAAVAMNGPGVASNEGTPLHVSIASASSVASVAAYQRRGRKSTINRYFASAAACHGERLAVITKTAAGRSVGPPAA